MIKINHERKRRREGESHNVSGRKKKENHSKRYVIHKQGKHTWFRFDSEPNQRAGMHIKQWGGCIDIVSQKKEGKRKEEREERREVHKYENNKKAKLKTSLVIEFEPKILFTINTCSKRTSDTIHLLLQSANNAV